MLIKCYETIVRTAGIKFAIVNTSPHFTKSEAGLIVVCVVRLKWDDDRQQNTLLYIIFRQACGKRVEYFLKDCLF